MKIMIEANIPYIKGLLEPFGTVEYLKTEEITADSVADADALFVRTRTRCDAALLSGSKVRFIATATIGTDHIDSVYCAGHGISVNNAPGCNAPAVAQYVFSVIGNFFGIGDTSNLTLGVVGVGHVGSIVARWGRWFGMNVMECDPPRQRKEGGNFVGLDDIERHADIVTFHTPLNKEGEDCTVHLADRNFFDRLRKCRLLINSSRGEVVDNIALLSAMETTKMDAAIDCWENEPDINRELLRKAFVATPHIAGYSVEGKMRATAMTLRAFERFYNVKIDGIPVVTAPYLGADVIDLQQAVISYDPTKDTYALKKNPDLFEYLRNNYDLRHEI